MEEMFSDVNAAMRARAAETIYGGRIKEEEGLGGVRVKTEEDRPIKGEYVPTSELVDILAQGQQALREREWRGVKREETAEAEINAAHCALGIKSEPGDVPMPRARPANKRFDPFDGYEPGSSRGGVKNEEETERQSSSRR
jgi:hypothetical protein